MTADTILSIDSQAQLWAVKKLPDNVLVNLLDRLTFLNPAYLEAEKRGFYTGNIPPEIRGYQVDGDVLTMPRGFTRQLVGILKKSGIQYRVEDHRRVLPQVDFTFKGELRDFQVEAVEAMEARDFGTLSAATGSGKTVMALALIARRRQPALVIVHAKE
jgi:hypothetical protein